MPEQDDDAMVAEITNGMESVRLPSDSTSGDVRMESVQLQAAAEGQANIVTPNQQKSDKKQDRANQALRPFDAARAAGPAHHPIDFLPPVIERGVRDNVLCYNQRTQHFIKADNVLFRDYTRDFGDSESALQRVERAYWPVPHKSVIKTIMGM